MARIAALITLVFALNGCAMVRAPATGFFYTDTQSGMDSTSNQAGNRIGVSCLTTILGLVATGDASIESARRNGGITLISSVDETSQSYVGVYGKYCVVVRGR